MKKAQKLHLSRLLTRKYLTALGILVAIIALISLYKYTHPEKDVSIKSCTSELATGVTEIDYVFSSSSTPPPSNYSYTISLDCNGSALDVSDSYGKHFKSVGRNEPASQQIIAALAADLAARVPANNPNNGLDCTTLVGGPVSSISLINDAAKSKTDIALCKFSGDERATALVDQIKALIPDLETIISAHHK